MRTSRTQLEATVKRQRRYRSLLKIRREREWIGKASRGKRGRLENIRMMRKILINGLFAGSIILIVGMISGQVFQLLVPSLVDEYGNERIFRPWSDPIMSGMYLQPILSGIILAWIWTKTRMLFTQLNYLITLIIYSP